MNLRVMAALHDLGIDVDAEVHEYAAQVDVMVVFDPDTLFRLCMVYRPPYLGTTRVRYVPDAQVQEAERENPCSVLLPYDETGTWTGMCFIPKEDV